MQETARPLEVEAERGPVPDDPHSHFFMVRDFDLIPLRGSLQSDPGQYAMRRAQEKVCQLAMANPACKITAVALMR